MLSSPSGEITDLFNFVWAERSKEEKRQRDEPASAATAKGKSGDTEQPFVCSFVHLFVWSLYNV